VRLVETHAACAVLQTAPFTEDHLYANLAWLADEQARIEQRLQRSTPPAPFSGVVLEPATWEGCRPRRPDARGVKGQRGRCPSMFSGGPPASAT